MGRGDETRNKFIQFNAGRSIAAHDCLKAVIKDQKIDIAIISGPNKKLPGKEGNWITGNRSDTMIKIYTHTLAVDKRGWGDGFCYVDKANTRIISSYISPARNMDEFKRCLEDMDNIIKMIKTNP